MTRRLVTLGSLALILNEVQGLIFAAAFIASGGYSATVEAARAALLHILTGAPQ